MRLILGFPLVFAFFLSACSKAPSNDIKTDSIFLSGDVSVRGDLVDCSAALTVGGPTGTQVELSKEDYLTCDGKEMTGSTDALGQIRYVATVSLRRNSGDNQVYRLQLNRPGETVTADVSLSSPIEGVQVVNDNNLVLRNPLQITWQPSRIPSEKLNAEVTLTVAREPGISSQSAQTSGAPESGRLDLILKPVLKWNDASRQWEAVSGPYEAKLVLSRSNRGALSGKWKGNVHSTARKEINLRIVD